MTQSVKKGISAIEAIGNSETLKMDRFLVKGISGYATYYYLHRVGCPFPTEVAHEDQLLKNALIKLGLAVMPQEDIGSVRKKHGVDADSVFEENGGNMLPGRHVRLTHTADNILIQVCIETAGGDIVENRTPHSLKMIRKWRKQEEKERKQAAALLRRKGKVLARVLWDVPKLPNPVTRMFQNRHANPKSRGFGTGGVMVKDTTSAMLVIYCGAMAERAGLCSLKEQMAEEFMPRFKEVLTDANGAKNALTDKDKRHVLRALNLMEFTWPAEGKKMTSLQRDFMHGVQSWGRYFHDVKTAHTLHKCRANEFLNSPHYYLKQRE